MVDHEDDDDIILYKEDQFSASDDPFAQYAEMELSQMSQEAREQATSSTTPAEEERRRVSSGRRGLGNRRKRRRSSWGSLLNDTSKDATKGQGETNEQEESTDEVADAFDALRSLLEQQPDTDDEKEETETEQQTPTKKTQSEHCSRDRLYHTATSELSGDANGDFPATSNENGGYLDASPFNLKTQDETGSNVKITPLQRDERDTATDQIEQEPEKSTPQLLEQQQVDSNSAAATQTPRGITNPVFVLPDSMKRRTASPLEEVMERQRKKLAKKPKRRKSHSSAVAGSFPSTPHHETTNQRNSHSVNRILPMATPKPSSVTKKASVRKVSVVKSKSIVGSRPSHWAPRKMGHLTSKKPRVSMGTKRATPSRTAQLAAATRSTVRLASHHFSTPLPAVQVRSQPQSKSAVAPVTDEKENRRNRQSSEEKPGVLTFTPAFLSSDHPRAVDLLEEGAETDPMPRWKPPDHRVSATPSMHPSETSSNPAKKRRSRSEKKAGALIRKLKIVRASLDGELVRFKSGIYPFSNSSKSVFDMNDPRNRASSFMDVTLLGDLVPWSTEKHRLTGLCFIHAHKETNKSHNNAAIQVSQSFSWICFLYETAREKNLRSGSQLRIYNPVVTQCCGGPTLNADSEAGQPLASKCRHTVLCTQLCEEYPTVLPKLPDRHEILASAAQ